MRNLRIVAKTPAHIDAIITSWEGPIEPGRQGRSVDSPLTRFKRDQGEVASLGQRHAIGVDASGNRVATVSQSVGYWHDLSKHLRWTIVQPNLNAPLYNG